VQTLGGAGGFRVNGFGRSLAVHNGELLVGAGGEPHYNPDGKTYSHSGALYLFQNADPSWNGVQLGEVAHFQPPDNTSFNYVGWTVALNDSSILAPAPFDVGSQGEVFAFESSLAGATSLALSAPTDPANLYVASPLTSSISVFQRDVQTGRLTFVQAVAEGDQQKVLDTNGNTVTLTVAGLGGADSVAVSPDGSTVLVSAFFDNQIAVFHRDPGTGKLTFASTVSDPNLATPTSLALDTQGTHLYVTTRVNNSLLVFAKNADGTWSLSQQLQNGLNGVTGLSGPVSLTLSADGRNIYVAAQGSSSLALFARDAGTGLLTFEGAVVNGQDGVDGLGGASSVAVSPDGQVVVVAGGDENAAAAFRRDPTTGLLTFVQVVQNHTGGVQGLALPVSLAFSPDGRQVYAGSLGGAPGEQGGIAWFGVDATAPPPANFNVTFSGIASLTVNTAGGNDHVSLGDVVGPSAISINTGAGADTVVDQDTTSSQTVNIDLGDGADVLDLRATGQGSTTTITGDAGNDTFRIWAVARGSTVNVNGGAGDDTFRVVGTALGGTLNIDGGTSDTPLGDVLQFDSRGRLTYPFLPTNPFYPNPTNGTLQVGISQGQGVTTPDPAYQPLAYNAIETIEVLTAPVAVPRVLAPVQEGGSVTLDASASSVTQGPGTFAWDLTGNGTFTDATGVSPTLTWAQLNQLGIVRAGAYTVWLRVTDAAGNIDEASTTLQVVNQAPANLTITNSGPVVAGSPVTITASASDAGGAGDPLTYEFDFNGDGVYDAANSSGVTSHTFATPGTYTVGVAVVDADGATVTGTTTVTVNPLVPAVRTISGASAVEVGATYLLSLLASGPGADAITSWTINWGDGSLQTVTGNPPAVTHVYATPGAYAVGAVAADPAGTRPANNLNVTATPVPVVAPGLTLSGSANNTEGDPYTLNLAILPRSGSDTIKSWIIRWGDLTTQTVPADTTSLTHVFKGPATYTISAVAIGQNVTWYAGNTVSVTVADVLPVLHVSGPTSVSEGTQTTFRDGQGRPTVVPGSVYTLTLSGQAVGVDPIQGWVVNWGDGNVQTFAGNPTSVTHSFAYRPTPYTISASAWDLDSSPNNPSPAPETVTVSVQAVAPQLLIGGAATTYEGSTYQLSLRSFEPSGRALTGWTINWGDGTTSQAAGDAQVATHVYASASTFTITATATDASGTYAASGSVKVQVFNPNPTNIQLSLASGDISEGGVAVLSGSFTDPGAPGTHTVDVNWGDGSAHTTLTLGTGLLSFSGVSHQYLDNPAGQPTGSYTLTVTITNTNGGKGGATTSVEVDNVAPAAGVSGPALGVRGQPLSFTLTASDPSPVDQQAEFTFHVNWGDGTTQVVTGRSGLALEHAYTSSGKYAVQVTATDKDGATGPAATFQTDVEATALIGGVLYVGGTNGDDNIVVNPGGGPADTVHVVLNCSVYDFKGVTKVVVFALGGDDNVVIAGGLTIPAEVYGGDGNDTLKAGGGPTILDGGAGNDTLVGGRGPDVLIGGTGADVLQAGPGGDVLLAGDFMTGSTFGARQAALDRVLSEWASTDSYAVRVSALQATLAAGASDDGSADTLIGGSGQDWFLADLSGAVRDLIKHRSPGETVTDLGAS
jgi:6-phosphogluconolactonase (cycloisomerase 2 family)/Ca2+-binding RTX toxin-like protein